MQILLAVAAVAADTAAFTARVIQGKKVSLSL